MQEEADVMAYDPLDLVDDDEEDGSAVQVRRAMLSSGERRNGQQML
jgi:hypothetical protein